MLQTPEEVADWVAQQRAQLTRQADGDAQARNALMVAHAGAYRGAAARGSSVYSSVHASSTEVWDICAEVIT